mgnify:CR=1 FL=1
MKKLFYLLLCLPLAFAACQPEEPGVENKVYNLSVTSESVLNFEAEGGQGVITYNLAEVTRTKPVPEPQVDDIKIRLDQGVIFPGNTGGRFKMRVDLDERGVVGVQFRIAYEKFCDGHGGISFREMHFYAWIKSSIKV